MAWEFCLLEVPVLGKGECLDKEIGYLGFW